MHYATLLFIHGSLRLLHGIWLLPFITDVEWWIVFGLTFSVCGRDVGKGVGVSITETCPIEDLHVLVQTLSWCIQRNTQSKLMLVL